MAAVFLLLVRVKACTVPLDDVMAEAAVAGVRSVCIQWRKVCGVLFDGMSRSTIITAYEVPVSCVCVANVGWLAVAKKRYHQIDCSSIHTLYFATSDAKTCHLRAEPFGQYMVMLTCFGNNDAVHGRGLVVHNNQVGIRGRCEAGGCLPSDQRRHRHHRNKRLGNHVENLKVRKKWCQPVYV